MDEILVEHPHPVLIGVEITKTPCFDEQQRVDDGQRKQKNAVVDFLVGESETEKGRGCTDGPVGRAIEALPPGKTTRHLGPIIVNQSVHGFAA